MSKTPPPAEPGLWVRFDTPGVHRIGHYLPGKPYRVAADEAERLMKAKGFTACDAPGDTATDQPREET